jgi:hypothetical protein
MESPAVASHPLRQFVSFQNSGLWRDELVSAASSRCNASTLPFDFAQGLSLSNGNHSTIQRRLRPLTADL